jgi:anti-anti-sigma factor
MEITVRQHEDFTIVGVKGRVIRENQGELRKLLEEVVSRGIKGIALDFEAVDYIDSAGLGCCAAVHKLLQDKKSGALVMFGASPNIEKMWKLIRLDLVIPVYQKEKEALSRLEASVSSPPGPPEGAEHAAAGL